MIRGRFGRFAILLSVALAAFGLSARGLLSCSPSSGDERVRPAAVAGTFYPTDPQALRAEVNKDLAAAEKVAIDGRILGMLVPHAGYAYSAPTAACGYKQILGQKYDLIVVLAPSHREPFWGATIYPGSAYQTPLGRTEIDQTTAANLASSCDAVKLSETGHGAEHAVEVQLPFLQTLLPNTKILPIVVGGYDWLICEKIGKALAQAVKGRQALLVASSDLCHGESYDQCKETDRLTLEAITQFKPQQLCQGLLREEYQACGGGPIVIMQVAAQALGANRAKLIARTNSNDVTGQKGGYVVGYGSVAIYAQESRQSERIEFQPLDLATQKDLLRMARQAITGYLNSKTIPRFEPTAEVMNEKRGVFVTLTEDGVLRGCIGYHENDRPLYQLVPDRAIAAAFEDPRFAPLRPNELDKIKIKISVYMTNVYRIAGLDEFEMGKHGIIMMKNGRGATYLPEVPLEAGWKSVEEEMESLCMKAGLSTDAWRSGAAFWVYKTQVFDENGLK